MGNNKDIIDELYKKFWIDPEKQKMENKKFLKEYYNKPWKNELNIKLQDIEEAMIEYNMSLEEVAAENLLRSVVELALKDQKEYILEELKKIEKEKFKDAEHCSCLSFAIGKLKKDKNI